MAGCALLTLGLLVVLFAGALSAPPYSLFQLLVGAIVAVLIFAGRFTRTFPAVAIAVAISAVAAGAFFAFLMVGKAFDSNSAEMLVAIAWAAMMFLLLSLCLSVGLVLWAGRIAHDGDPVE